MQTFLPYSTPIKCAEALDNKRLNKQILECYQILNVLSGNSVAWRNHPAVLMWEGSESELYRYGMTAIVLANMRGIKTDKNYNENKRNVIKLSESNEQLERALEYIKENPRTHFVGLSNKKNLIFKSGLNEVRITDDGFII